MGAKDEESVGFIFFGGDLCEKFIGRDASRGRERELLADGAADGLGDLGGGSETALIMGDVEVGLVEGEGLDAIAMARKDLADGARDLAIALKIGRHEDGVRA